MLKKGVFWALHTRHLQNGTAPPPPGVDSIHMAAILELKRGLHREIMPPWEVPLWQLP